MLHLAVLVWKAWTILGLGSYMLWYGFYVMRWKKYGKLVNVICSFSAYPREDIHRRCQPLFTAITLSIQKVCTSQINSICSVQHYSHHRVTLRRFPGLETYFGLATIDSSVLPSPILEL